MKNPQSTKREGISQKAKRTGLYSPDDSAIMFLCAILLPSLFAFPFAMWSSQTGKDIPTIFNYLIPQLAMLAGFFVLSGIRKVNYTKANGIKFKLNIWLVLLLPIISFISLYGFSPIVDLLDTLTESWGYQTSESLNITFSGFGDFVLKCLYIALLPAICEELTFRGVVANGFKKYGILTASFLTAFFFAIMHQNLQQLIYQFVIGFVFAYFALKGESIIYSFILHFVNNFVILLSTYISQQSGAEQVAMDYSVAWNVIWPILLAIVATGALVGILFLTNYIVKKTKQKQRANANQLAKQTEKEPQKFAESQDDDKFFKRPLVLTAMISGIIIWALAILQNFEWFGK